MSFMSLLFFVKQKHSQKIISKDKKVVLNKYLFFVFLSRLYVGMILILIFAEVLGLYGLIVALIMTTKNQPGCD